MFQIKVKCSKIPTGKRQTSWLARGVKLGATENKSREQQEEPYLQVQHPNQFSSPIFQIAYCRKILER